MQFIVLSTEISSTNKVDYREWEKVDYGYVPSRNKRIGFMRFEPGAGKCKGPCSAELVSCIHFEFYFENFSNIKCLLTTPLHYFTFQELHILRGEFKIQSGDIEFEAIAGTDLTIPKDAEYGLVNCGDDIGFIHFTYAN